MTEHLCSCGLYTYGPCSCGRICSYGAMPTAEHMGGRVHHFEDADRARFGVPARKRFAEQPVQERIDLDRHGLYTYGKKTVTASIVMACMVMA